MISVRKSTRVQASHLIKHKIDKIKVKLAADEDRDFEIVSIANKGRGIVVNLYNNIFEIKIIFNLRL
jgi:hypothetical protein